MQQVNTCAQIAERFEPNTLLWAFHTIQPASLGLRLIFTARRYARAVYAGVVMVVYLSFCQSVSLSTVLQTDNVIIMTTILIIISGQIILTNGRFA